jgi:8-oxo-dGTP pyrophosphatase MutT (NUDIX family)
MRADLQALLASHKPADALEGHHLEQMLALLQEPGDCWLGDHWIPGHFTGSAFVMSPDEGSLLFIHHSKLHRWLQPGGHFEDSDASVEAGARREVLEEVGISRLERIGDGLFDVDIHTIPPRPHKGEPEHLHLDVRLLFKAPSLDFQAGSDALDARWVPLAEITESESDASVMRAVAKLKSHGANSGPGSTG